MTVQTNTNVANFFGNGAATYPIGFKFNSAADLVVQKTVIATGVTTTLTLNSDYSVAGAGVEEGGSITFNQAPTSAESIKVTRVVDLLQLTDLRNQGKFYAEVHEEVFDKLVMIDQQQQTEIDDANAKSDEAVATANAANAKSDQAVAKAAQNLVDMQAQYDAFEQGAAFVVIGDYAAGLVVDGYNKVFRKDGEFYRAAASLNLPYTLTGAWASESANFVSVGDAVLREELLAHVSPEEGAAKVGRAVRHINSVSELRSVAGRYQDDTVFLVDYHGGWNVLTTPSPCGSGSLFWDATSTDPDNGGTVFAVAGVSVGRWKRPESESPCLGWFGARGDDSDETAEISAAATAYADSALTLKADGGRSYRFTNSISFFGVSLDLNGSTLTAEHVGNKCLLQLKGRAGVSNGRLVQAGTPIGELGLAGQRIIFGLDVHDCAFENLRFSCGSFGHAPFNIIGNCYNVDVSNISFDTGPWAMGLIIHWATVADSAAIDYASDIAYAAGASNATTHPRNITVDNVTGGAFNGAGTLVALLYLSGAYNIKASNLYADQIAKIVTVQAGDYGSDFAPAKEKKLITNGIVIDNPACPNITSTQGISISGQGMYAASRLRCDVTINNPELDTSLTGTRYGVFIDNCSGAKIIGGTIEGFSTNVFFQRNVTGGLLDGVRITRATGAGVVLDSDQDKVRGVTIRACQLYGNNTSAVELPNNSAIRISNTIQAKIVANKFGLPGVSETQRHSVYVNAGCDNISLVDNHTFASAETSAYHADATGGQFSMKLWDINNTSDTAFSTRPDGHVWSQPIGFGLRRTLLNTASSAPTTGTHKQGDEVIFRNATAGGHTGARCTAGGTPGTWKTFGAISA